MPEETNQKEKQEEPIVKISEIEKEPESIPMPIKMLEEIEGNFKIMSSVPTHTPRTLKESIILYLSGTTYRIYWYIKDAWKKIYDGDETGGGKYLDSNTDSSISVSGGWADLSTITITVTTGAKRVFLALSGCFMFVGLAGSQVQLRFNVDGTPTNTLADFLDNDGVLNGDQIGFCIHSITAVLSAGSHTFKVQGTGVTNSGILIRPVFTAMELS